MAASNAESDPGIGRGEGGAGVLWAALSASGDLAYIWNLIEDRIDWAGNLVDIFGPGTERSVADGEAFNERINAEDLARRLKILNEHISTGAPYDCEYRIRREDGSFIWVHDRGRVEADGPEGEPARLAGTLRVITRRKQAESLLEHRANYDELTGHLNKTRLREALQNAISYNHRYRVSGGYLAVGIDKLSMINDGYGHETADAAIIAAGQRIERGLRVTDIIGRIGGDRFGIVLAQCDADGLARTAQKILESFRTAPLETAAGPLRMTVSIGGVAIPGFIRTAQDAMTGAESALQDAKTAGRNCFVPYEMSAEQRERQRRNIETGEDVLRALDEGRIVLAYQPVVCARTRETRYYETLLRMYDEAGSLRSAGEFVPILEKLGLIRLLDLRALELAAADLRRYPEIALAVNVSSMTVIDPSWMRTLMGLVKSSRSLAERLTIEITETAALEDFDVTARFISTVRDLGCKVALDDFGSGYTSFRHMKSLTVDVVKIDGAFVTDIAHNQDNQLFVRTLLGLAEGFGLKTVAECIESEEDARILTREGADFLQGWHLGRPDVAPAWRSETNGSPPGER
ncbi:GGDEF and EAL domain-containing protein [Marivibrio halodurans]|uniref:GGDEF and EAL domain-containing protein n=1 Tax=Marivibrio halodurans TaxID=2039722 RepID=A0A8J7V3T0_9PROT|nr:GGDEF and EAL domain-containing protein [Marivibrio halodurans]MBP5858312.1 GGDEF and EAL domain-containing protein [Marivibrio halodurans]